MYRFIFTNPFSGKLGPDPFSSQTFFEKNYKSMFYLKRAYNICKVLQFKEVLIIIKHYYTALYFKTRDVKKLKLLESTIE